MPVDGRRDRRHPGRNFLDGCRVAIVVLLVASAVTTLGGGCSGLREMATTERIQVGGIEFPSRLDGKKSAPGQRGLPVVPLSLGEVRDRRIRAEDLGQGAVSSWNPLLSTTIAFGIPTPTPDPRSLKLEEAGELKATFRSDAARVLESEGLSIVSATPPREKSVPLRLDLEILEASAFSRGDVRTFLDKGTIVVSFGFSATISDAMTEDVLWRGWFGRKETMEARYFSRGKYEQALNQVYRKALEEFGKEASGGLAAKILLERRGEY